MQAFIKYTKQPSYFEDYWNIFDTGAKFKMFSPEELKRKCFFEQQLGPLIMGPFYHHLRKTKILPTSEKEVIESIEQNKINHDDLILEFSSWLDQEDTAFVYIEKQKTEPPKQSYYSQPPPMLSKAYPPPQKHSQPKKEPPFAFEKVSQTPVKANVIGTYQQNIHLAKLGQKPQRDTDRSFRHRFLQKLADYFQYPQRAVSIKADINLMMQPQGYKK